MFHILNIYLCNHGFKCSSKKIGISLFFIQVGEATAFKKHISTFSALKVLIKSENIIHLCFPSSCIYISSPGHGHQRPPVLWLHGRSSHGDSDHSHGAAVHSGSAGWRRPTHTPGETGEGCFYLVASSAAKMKRINLHRITFVHFVVWINT